MSKKRLVSLTLCFILIFSLCLPCFADTVKADDVRAQITDNTATLIAVSKYGDTVRYPENSSAGVSAAAESGADMVLIKIKKTADGVLVLFADDNLSRMCVDAEGNPVNRNIAVTSYDELSQYRLRVSHGGSGQTVTAYTVSTLADTVKELDGGALLLIDGWEYRDEIAEALDDTARQRVILIADGDKRELINNWLNKDRTPSVFSRYKGNIIWSCLSYINKTSSKGAQGIILASSNPYATTFSASVVSKAQSKLRAAIDMTDPKLCGKRDDTSIYWDDVTSRGFSVIITDDIAGLSLYKQRVEASRQRLAALTEKAESFDYTSMSTFNANKLKSALNRAEKAQATSVSAMALDNCYTELSQLMEEYSDEGARTHGVLTVSAGRIIAAIAVTAAFIFFELIIERVKNRRIVLRRKGIDKKGRYRLKDKDR